MSDRRQLAQDFLDRAGWGHADRRFLAGDASDRSYDRLIRGHETAVLMDAPPGKGDDPKVFLAIADHLRSLGLTAPTCYARDLTHGFLLLEDLGDGLVARMAAEEPQLEEMLYLAATKALVRLQNAPPAPDLVNLSAAAWAEAAAFALDWYRFAVTGSRIDSKPFVETLTQCLLLHADGPRVMILRDYHAENLLWLPERQGLGRLGILDFQLAQLGQPVYDLVSLLQDARRDVSRETQRAATLCYLDATGQSAADFQAAFAVVGAQRALRILGIFARLCLVSGKSSYLKYLPRVWRQLWENLKHPALGPVSDLCAELLPTPTLENLSLIGAQCARFP